MPPGYQTFTKPIVFRLDAPNAQRVSLVIQSAKKEGHPAVHAIPKGVDGAWTIRLEITRGRHLYRFLVDDVPTLDPTSLGIVHDGHHESWSLLEIGY
jgi:1,4-alpha-glucan branching enzyme